VFFGSCIGTVFVEFLKKLMNDARGPVYLVLDNVFFHRATIVREYVASLDGRLKSFFLLGYYPELNPAGWVCKDVQHNGIKRRGGTQRRSELFGIVTPALERLQGLPETTRGFIRDSAMAHRNVSQSPLATFLLGVWTSTTLSHCGDDPFFTCQ
jgi:hypothetical protein